MRKSACFHSGMMFQSLSLQLQESIRLFHNLIPSLLSAFLAVGLPHNRGEVRAYQVPYQQLTPGLEPAHLPTALRPCNSLNKQLTGCLPLWSRLVIIFSLFFCHDSAAIHLCCSSRKASPLNRLMLAIVVSPRSSDFFLHRDFVKEASYHRITPEARSFRLLLTE